MSTGTTLLVAFLCFAVASLGFDSSHASGTPSPTTESCRVAERDGAYFLQLFATPVATIDTDRSLVSDYRSSQKTAPQSAVEGILRTIHQLVECQNEGNFAAVAALFTDRYWASEIEGLPARADEFAAMAEATSRPPDEQMEQRASFSDARVLENGRVAGFLRWDGRRLDEVQLVALRLVNEAWLIDEVVFVGEVEVLGTPQPRDFPRSGQLTAAAGPVPADRRQISQDCVSLPRMA